MNNKNRFMMDTAGTLIDLDTLDTFDIVEEVVDLMNDLNNENKLLKSINQSHCMEKLKLKDYVLYPTFYTNFMKLFDEDDNRVGIDRGKFFFIEEDNIEVERGLLEDIRHELISLQNLYTFDKCKLSDNGIEIELDDLVHLDFEKLIEKIDKVI